MIAAFIVVNPITLEDTSLLEFQNYLKLILTKKGLAALALRCEQIKVSMIIGFSLI